MERIVELFVSEDSLQRLIYRLIARFGPLDLDLLALLVGYVLEKAHPEKALDDGLLYLTLQYRTNLSTVVATLESHGFVTRMQGKRSVLYCAYKAT